MQENESIFWSTFRKAFAARQQKKQFNAIEQGNVMRRGVVEYVPSQIEGFFDVNEPLGSVIASGGDCSVRCRAVAAAAVCAATQGTPVIVIHCGNTEMERQISNLFSPSPILQILNRNNPVYEPLSALNDSEISQLLIQSGVGLTAIPSGGRYYIEALASFLRGKGIEPYCKMFFACPHQQMSQAIDSAVQAGHFSVAAGQQIKSLVMQGQSYRSAVETFFSRLEQQSNHIMCDKGLLNRRTSLLEAAKQGHVTVVDIAADTNDLLINIIASEVEKILSCGIPLCLAVDDVSLVTNESITRLLRSSNNNFWRVISSRDFYSMSGSNDAVFSDITNTAHKLFISSHSGVSCAKWAQLIGEYDKDEVAQSFATAHQYSSFFTTLPGENNTQSVSVSHKREFIFKPEAIARFTQDEIVVINRITQELAHTFIV